ncbi:MAG: glycine cleavage T C-terminal barrel domain-containing protein [Polyangiaceae bacterium]
MDEKTGALFRGKSLLLQDASELGTIEAEGSEVRTWLNGMITCDLIPRKIGDGAFGLCAGKTGKILAELYVALLSEERFLIGVRREVLPAIVEHFDRHLVMEDVTLSDVSADQAWSFLHGAHAATFAGVVKDAGGVLVPLDFTGAGTCAVLAPTSAAEKVREAIVTKGGDDLLVLGADDFHAFRIEHGIAWFGHDFDEHSYAQEAGLERYGVSFTKGCYLGQEAVFMLQVRGHVKKRLVQLAIEGAPAIAKGTAIALPDGAEVGAVTSVAPAVDGRTLALGHVKYKHAKPGGDFVVAGAKAVSTEAIPAPKE